MQSSDIQRFSEARHLSVSSLLPATAKSIPPGALAGYLKAQQAWRKSHASTKCAGQKSSRVQLQHFEYSGQSCSSQTSCSTADNYFRHPAYGLPAPGSKLVAQLLQSRHDLLARHRDQRQLAKRRRTREAQQEPSASLLSLPEDVLLHIVYKLDHEDVEPLFRVCHELRSMTCGGVTKPMRYQEAAPSPSKTSSEQLQQGPDQSHFSASCAALP